LLKDPVLDSLEGLGTGKLRDSYEAIARGDGRFFLSGMSSKAVRDSPTSCTTNAGSE
jgi:uncharacterized protein